VLSSIELLNQVIVVIDNSKLTCEIIHTGTKVLPAVRLQIRNFPAFNPGTNREKELMDDICTSKTIASRNGFSHWHEGSFSPKNHIAKEDLS
jgi:hypothetical protein